MDKRKCKYAKLIEQSKYLLNVLKTGHFFLTLTSITYIVIHPLVAMLEVHIS